MSVPIIEGSGSGYWPTPRVCSAMAATITPESVWKDDRFPNLETIVGRRMWGTPNAHPRTFTPRAVDHGIQLANQVAMFPTPAARDWKSSNASPETMDRNARPLNETVTQGAGGQLNPTWVEWLMGFPLGWTGLDPLETGRFRQWQEQHGSCSPELIEWEKD